MKDISLLIEGKEQDTSQHYAAVAGIDLQKNEINFLTAVGASSPDQLNLPGSPDNPEDLRQALVERKVTISEKGGSFLIREADKLFEEFFDNHFEQLAQLLAEGRNSAAKEFIANRLREILRDSGANFDVTFIKPESTGHRGQETGGISKSQSDSGEAQVKEENPPRKTESYVPISPLVGLEEGIKVENAGANTRVMVKLAPEAIEKLEAKIADEQKLQQITKPRPARILNFTATTDQELKMRVELEEGIVGACEVSPESLLKPAPKRAAKRDSYEQNIIMIIWLLVLLIVLSGSYLLFL